MAQHTVAFTGNIVSEIKTRKVTNEHSVAKFRLACSRGRFNKENNNWHNYDQLFIDVDAWDTLGRNVAISLKQNDTVLVLGTLITQEWNDEKKGPQQRVVVKASHVGPDLNKVVATTTTASALAEKKAMEELAKRFEELNKVFETKEEPESQPEPAPDNLGEESQDEGELVASGAEGGEPPF